MMALDLLRKRVIEARQAIIWHAYQVGDDRCWMDDWWVYAIVLNLLPPRQLSAEEICLTYCQQYRSERALDFHTFDAPPISEVHLDVVRMSLAELIKEWYKIKTAVIIHWLIGDGKRTLGDDQQMYQVVNGLISDPWMPSPDMLFPNCRHFIRTRKGPETYHEWGDVSNPLAPKDSAT
jgi:hypothetical protein